MDLTEIDVYIVRLFPGFTFVRVLCFLRFVRLAVYGRLRLVVREVEHLVGTPECAQEVGDVLVSVDLRTEGGCRAVVVSCRQVDAGRQQGLHGGEVALCGGVVESRPAVPTAGR